MKVNIEESDILPEKALIKNEDKIITNEMNEEEEQEIEETPKLVSVQQLKEETSNDKEESSSPVESNEFKLKTISSKQNSNATKDSVTEIDEKPTGMWELKAESNTEEVKDDIASDYENSSVVKKLDDQLKKLTEMNLEVEKALEDINIQTTETKNLVEELKRPLSNELTAASEDGGIANLQNEMKETDVKTEDIQAVMNDQDDVSIEENSATESGEDLTNVSENVQNELSSDGKDDF